MLGSVKHKAGWIWYASGKHPAAKDFFEIGVRDPLLQAFANWVAGGFRQWANQNERKSAQNSWRFWTRSTHKQQLLCGISRDSCDSFGRAFPLVVVGCGHLNKWQAHWELLPIVLDKTWQQMEYLATKRLSDFSHLEDEVRLLPHPTESWAGTDLDRQSATCDNPDLSGSAPDVSLPQHSLSDRADPLVGMMPLVNISQIEQPKQLCMLYARMKKHSKQPPNAVFMGGVPEKSCLVMFNRPLRSEDFSALWSSCPAVSPAPG
jgi:type VI secretion system protein VasJ